MGQLELHLLLAELFLIVLATVTALFSLHNFEVSEAMLLGFAPYLVLTIATAMVILASFRTYRSVWRFAGLADYLRVVSATGAIVGGAGALGLWFNCIKRDALTLPILQGLLVLFLLVGVRVLVRLFYAVQESLARRKATKEASSYESLLVIGLGTLADHYLRVLSQFEPHQVRIEGLLDDTGRQIGRCIHGHPILGTPERVANVLRDLEIHGVVINRIVSTTPFEQLSPQAQVALQDTKKSKNINLEFLEDELGLGRRSREKVGFSSDRTEIRSVDFPFGPKDLASLTRRPYLRIKRALEPVGAVGLIIVLAPLFLLVVILTVIDVGLPATFWQLRPGFNRRLFKLYKFRTMSAAFDVYGNRVPEKERTSAAGHFLRRTRLDESPQLFNILFGEMSFIGPRPLLPIDQPDAAYAARLLVRPGLTGWAQVKGGRDISPDDKAALDVWYVRNESLSLDLKILAFTVSMVIFGEKVDRDAIRVAWQDLQRLGTCPPSDWAIMQCTSVPSLVQPEVKKAG